MGLIKQDLMVTNRLDSRLLVSALFEMVDATGSGVGWVSANGKAGRRAVHEDD